MTLSGKIAFVFPGQGSQSVGMGRDFFESSSEAKQVFETVDAVLGFNLSRLMFEGPEEELTQTVNTQPALLTVSVAALRALESKGISPSVTAGHSVGEYAALVASRALAFEDAVRLVRRRGELMAQAGAKVPGTMAAVLGLSADDVRTAVESAQGVGVVDVANYNSPGQVVISGSPEGVEEAARIAKEAGAKRVVPLKVSGAFHSRLMADAAQAMKVELEKTAFADPFVPIVANVTADYVKSADEVRDALARQIVGSVRWEESIRKIAGDGVDTFVEAGSGNVLAGLIKKIVSDVTIASVGDTNALGSLIA